MGQFVPVCGLFSTCNIARAANLALMSDMKSKFIDDVAALASGPGVAAQGVREEIEQAEKGRFDALLAENGMVSREEFEAVRDMVMELEPKMMRCAPHWMRLKGPAHRFSVVLNAPD